MNSKIAMITAATGDAPCSMGGLLTIPRLTARMCESIPHKPAMLTKESIGCPGMRGDNHQANTETRQVNNAMTKGIYQRDQAGKT